MWTAPDAHASTSTRSHESLKGHRRIDASVWRSPIDCDSRVALSCKISQTVHPLTSNHLAGHVAKERGAETNKRLTSPFVFHRTDRQVLYRIYRSSFCSRSSELAYPYHLIQHGTSMLPSLWRSPSAKFVSCGALSPSTLRSFGPSSASDPPMQPRDGVLRSTLAGRETS